MKFGHITKKHVVTGFQGPDLGCGQRGIISGTVIKVGRSKVLDIGIVRPGTVNRAIGVNPRDPKHLNGTGISGSGKEINTVYTNTDKVSEMPRTNQDDGRP